MNNPQIAIAGIGGVGGYLAALLAKAYPDITFVTRGHHLQSLKENGLTLHSECSGEMTSFAKTVTTAVDLEPQDYIFICVKNYSLEQVCQELKHAVTDQTIIIPVMNGIDPGDKIRQYINRGTVVDSLIYIVTYKNADYSITQTGDFARLYIGIQNADPLQTEAVNKVSEILSTAHIDHKISEDISQAIWKKYILNCGFNVLTAAYNNTIGELRKDERKCKDYEFLTLEAWKLAERKGIQIPETYVQGIIHKFYHQYAEDATSSLQRDICNGKPSELETFSGYIVNEAHRLGLSLPVSEKYYARLSEKVK